MKTSYFGRLNSKKYGSLKGKGVSIARSAKYWDGPSYPPLFPTWEMIRCGDKDKYEEMYRRDVLSKLDPLEVWNDLGDDAILLCHESIDKIQKGEQFCHRHIVAKWLEEELWLQYDINVTIDEVDEKDINSFKFKKEKYEQLSFDKYANIV